MPAVVCPSCGTNTDLERFDRSAQEFCPKCDYPLFWAPTTMTVASVLGDESTEATLRRLPGVAGRRALAQIPCPTCAELNEVTAETCTRCGGPMVVAEPEPAPEPEPEPEPAPEPEPEPEKDKFPWWFWVALGVGLLMVTALVLLLAS